MAEAEGVGLEALSLNSMQEVEPRLTDAIFSVLSVEASAASRESYGGTAPVRVREQIELWTKRLGVEATT